MARSYVHQAFDATPYAVNGLQKSEVQELKDAFNILDPNGTGKIDQSGKFSLR